MSYKLYMGGYRYLQGVVIAKDREEAEVKLREKLNLGSLPCEFEEVELNDHAIVLKDGVINVSECDVKKIKEFTEKSIATVKKNIKASKKSKA